MALRDEIKAGRRELMKNGTPKEKLSYFFDYYTLHLIVAIVVIAFTTFFIHDIVTKPETVLSGIVLNVYNYDNNDPVKELGDGFLKYIDKDSSKYEVSLNSSLNYKMGSSEDNSANYTDYESSQAIMVQCAGGTIDFIASPLNSVKELAYGELFVNLEKVLSEEELALYEPYLLYVDRAVIAQKNEAIDNDENADLIPSPDPSKPEEMEDPIPVFIDVSKCEKMTELYSYSADTLVVGVAIKASNKDMIPTFLEYLFN